MDKQTLNIINTIPIWNGNINIKKLEGGITNENFLVEDNKNKYVVRLGNDIPEHLVLRSNEVLASKAAAKCGISPNVIYHNKGILVLDFIKSKTLTDVDIKKNIVDIIPIIKKIHKEIPKNIYGQSLIFWVFHVINNYAKFLNDNNSPHIKILDVLLKKSQQIEEIASPFEIVFGHNDLLPANFLDDGSRIWIIDWEYAGYNSPLFDLGGLASNNNFERKDEIFLLENYFDRKISDNLLLQYDSMKCASLLREAMWSMVSEITSKIDFDYFKYTQLNITKFNQAFNALQIY
jgi:thiamine kinase-like enzyme